MTVPGEDQPVLGQTRTDTISFSSVGFTYGIRRARLGADVGWYERAITAEAGYRVGLSAGASRTIADVAARSPGHRIALLLGSDVSPMMIPPALIPSSAFR